MVDDLQADAVDVVIAAARIFASVTAESIAQAGLGVTLPQLRVLTVARESGPLCNADVARILDIHISNASRLCDRLVQAGLLDRRESATDRRQVDLTVTDDGRRLLDAVTGHRREVFTRVLARMESDDRRALLAGLTGFVGAGEPEASRVLGRF